MDEFIICLIALIIVITLLTKYESFTSELVNVQSNVDSEKHLVQNMDDKERAADMLAIIKKKLDFVCKEMKKKYPNDERVKRVCSRFNPDSIVESEPNSKHTSYSVNKGEKIVICMREKGETNELSDINTITFVALHELAHLMTVAIGHDNDEFWNNFKFILRESVKCGIYKCVNYNKNPQKYCGITVTDNPISCNDIM